MGGTKGSGCLVRLHVVGLSPIDKRGTCNFAFALCRYNEQQVFNVC